MEILTYLCVGGAVVAFLLMFGFAKRKDKGKQGLICLLLGVAFVVGAVKLDNAVRDRRAQNTEVASQSQLVQQAIGTLKAKYTPNSNAPEDYVDAYELVFEPDDTLSAHKPYAAVFLKVAKVTHKPAYAAFYLYSEGGKVTPEALDGCKTLAFILQDTWATAQYTTSGSASGSRSWGTSQRYRVYLYDVEAGKVFAGTEIKAKSLPDKTTKDPHYYVSQKQVTDWIDAQME